MRTPSCILLDRDGTLILEREYLADPAGVELLPGTVEGLKALRQLGCPLIVVTNQSGIARGRFTWPQLAAIHRRMLDLLAQDNLTLDAIYVCPHEPADQCRCRKPRPGLVEQAAGDWHFEVRASVVIGDKSSDVELGRNVGATSILVRSGYGEQYALEESARGTVVVNDLAAVATWLTDHNHGSGS